MALSHNQLMCIKDCLEHLTKLRPEEVVDVVKALGVLAGNFGPSVPGFDRSLLPTVPEFHPDMTVAYGVPGMGDQMPRTQGPWSPPGGYEEREAAEDADMVPGGGIFGGG